MIELPSTLTYFANLQTVGKMLKSSSLKLVEAHELNDPFLPDRHSTIAFTNKQMFEAAVKYISHAILGKSPPRGQPNHPLQKAMVRWRAENRFSGEAEVREALQGLLPAMVEKSFKEAESKHQGWVDYALATRVACFYEKPQELALWQAAGVNHRGVAIKFRCDSDSIFKLCRPVIYQKHPAQTVALADYIEYLVGAKTEIDFDPEKIILSQSYAQRHVKEWRMLSDKQEGDETCLEFSTDLIQSIYIGALVPDKSVEQLKGHFAKNNPEINIFQARPKLTEYALEFDKISEDVADISKD